MLSALTIGAAASKKYKEFSPIKLAISSENLSVVKGPVEIIVNPSGNFVISSLKKFNFLYDVKICVISFAKFSLFTASAFPAGTGFCMLN